MFILLNNTWIHSQGKKFQTIQKKKVPHNFLQPINYQSSSSFLLRGRPFVSLMSILLVIFQTYIYVCAGRQGGDEECIMHIDSRVFFRDWYNFMCPVLHLFFFINSMLYSFSCQNIKKNIIF